MYSKIKNILNGVNLLIVEDDESLRESIKISVENYVSEVYACANAKEALEVFEAKGVNLVLSDINMPHMNGLSSSSSCSPSLSAACCSWLRRKLL